MRNRVRRLTLLLSIMFLTSLACATLLGGETPAPLETATEVVGVGEEITPQPVSPTLEQTEPPSPGSGENASGPGADRISLDDPLLYIQPDAVNTYRTSLVYTFSGQAADGSVITDSITGEGAFSVDPYQVSFTFHTTDSTVPGETFEIVQTDNTMYMSSQDIGCFSFPITEEAIDNPYEELLDTGGALAGQAQRIQPDETINGVPVYVYEITTDNLDLSDPAAQVEVITFGRLYLAKDGGYVVRVVLDGRGKSAVLEEGEFVGDVHYELNYFDHNQPVDIVPPTDCGTEAGGSEDGGSAAGGFPVPEGAADLVSMPGFVSFSTTQTVDEIATYYKTEMANQGWTLSDEVDFAGLATLTFTKDGKTANITITPDEASGNTLVLIVEG